VWPKLLSDALSSHKADAKQDKIYELIGAHVVLDGSMEQFCLNPRRRLSPIYASAELLWYLSREKSADMICAYAPQYKQFCDEDGTAYGAYGARLARNLALGDCMCGDLLEFAVAVLRERSSTKKCVVALWRPDDLVSQLHRDIPCTLTWQFLLRGERLHMICSMRSNDLWKGFLYDCYVNTVIQRYVAAELGCTAGQYHHVAGSLHLYERDARKAEEAMDSSFDMTMEPYHPSSNHWTNAELRQALAMESCLRCDTTDQVGGVLPSVLRDAVSCCAAKFGAQEDDPVMRSPGLRLAMNQYLKEVS
jgi:thymidylate synthase